MSEFLRLGMILICLLFVPSVDVLCQRGTSSKEVDMAVDAYFEMLPKEVQEEFFAEGWSYTKSKVSLRKKYHLSGNILGCTDPLTKSIYIDNRDCANAAILHEVGHAFDMGGIVRGSDDEEFLTLYKQNWKNWYKSYTGPGGHKANFSTPLEAYAQCYEIYTLQPDALDENTQEFIENEFTLIEKEYYKAKK